MRKRYIYFLVDGKGNLVLQGKKKEVFSKSYQRYVYGHIFDDEIYREDEVEIICRED